jgi:Flp pilus assembly protein TadD/predicted AlkP superfamily pyrophosphatase or phosphodiesterase
MAAAGLFLLALAGCGGGRGGGAGEPPVTAEAGSAHDASGSRGGESPAPAAGSGAGRRLIVVGLDAADPRFVSRGIASGELPNFARVAKEGAWGPLHTHKPILSPILWTTMATGLTPDRHGVLDFVEEDASGRTVPITSRSMKAAPFWQILESRGVSCGVVGWLATWPAVAAAEPSGAVRDGAPAERGSFIVSDRFTIHPYADPGTEVRRESPEGKTWPPGLYHAIEGAIVEPDDLGDAEIAALFGVAPAGRSQQDRRERRELRVVEATTRTYADVSLRLWRERRPDLLAVYFEGIDRLMHMFGAMLPPPLPGTDLRKARRFGRVVPRFYAAMDARLGEYLEAAGPEGTVLIVSDHGFKIGDERPRHPALRSDLFAADWHHDPGIVMAWGRGVARGGRIEKADIYDVAPTILAFFGAPATEGMRGRILSGLFEPGFLPPAPARVADMPAASEGRGPASEAPGAGAGAATRSGAESGPEPGADPGSEEERAILENLRALGYVGGDGRAAAARSSANLATFYLEDGQIDRAIDIYRLVLEKDPTDLTSLYNLGYAYKARGAAAPAAGCFEKILRVRPDYMEARLLLSECYDAAGRRDEALGVLEKAEAEGTSDPAYQNHLGTVLAGLGRLTEAEAALGRAIALRPGEASAYLNLARVRLARGDREGAEAALREAEARAPGDPRVAARLEELGGRQSAPGP